MRSALLMRIKDFTEEKEITVALIGNPNVGKSTLFNGLTGLKQHTGNWAGKTVDSARGTCEYDGKNYALVDLPGTYSLAARSPEEEISRDFIMSDKSDCVIVVCDATCLERNLMLALQVKRLKQNAVICVNLMDEAAKKGISVDTGALSKLMGMPAVPAAARSKKGLNDIMRAVSETAADARTDFVPAGLPESEEELSELCAEAERIASLCVKKSDESHRAKQLFYDKIFTGKYSGTAIMSALLLVVFFLTIKGANYPSQLLQQGFAFLEEKLGELLIWLGSPSWLHGALTEGVLRVTGWVVSVMLPPMAIFFPLFSLLEDVGYLPRVAFNLDSGFKRCGACGKQGLTMCMGIGCNAVGVTGCRIIDSGRERLIAVITNSLVPCNGRFPTLIAITAMFIAGMGGGFGSSLLGALALTVMLLLSVAMTFFASKLLSNTVLKGEPSAFTLEMPPFRRPLFGTTLLRSMLDRTVFVLYRAVAVAAPAGLFIWALGSIDIAGVSVLAHCSGFLDPFAKLFGMDGVILLAFILGLPANEIVMPLILMMYLSAGSLSEYQSLFQLKDILLHNGWTLTTALCTLLFTLFHWPCSTTLITIYKETKKLRWTMLSALLPSAIGLAACFLLATIMRIFA